MRTVINFLMRAASTLKITNGEQRALRKVSASWNLSLLKRCLRQVIWPAPSKQDNRRKARKHVKILSRFNHSHYFFLKHPIMSGPES